MGVLVAVLTVFALLAIIIAVRDYQQRWTWAVARPRLEATWPMRPGAKEGFQNMTVEQWLPAPEVLTKPAVGECPGTLMDAANYKQGPVGTSYDLLKGWLPGKPEPRVASGPTSQQCYTVDYSRTLERGGSYAQRTNNYRHGNAESCSAPNHDLILDFYQDRPTAAPYQV